MNTLTDRSRKERSLLAKTLQILVDGSALGFCFWASSLWLHPDWFSGPSPFAVDVVLPFLTVGQLMTAAFVYWCGRPGTEVVPVPITCSENLYRG